MKHVVREFVRKREALARAAMLAVRRDAIAITEQANPLDLARNVIRQSHIGAHFDPECCGNVMDAHRGGLLETTDDLNGRQVGVASDYRLLRRSHIHHHLPVRPAYAAQIVPQAPQWTADRS